MVAMTGWRYKGARTDPQKGYRHIPLMHFDDLKDAIPYDCVPVAVDLLDGARSMQTYTHPERAFYIFGPEDGTLGRAVTEWCRDVIYIPTAHCMNLAATVNVVLYDRMVKRGESSPAPRNKAIEAK
jgi:tRNA(Leu) C34 or U34 (ribose-2'-O)-methylase TrmL